MACVLTTGRSEPCSDAIGGISKIYLADYLEDSFTVVAGEATAMNASLTAAFEFDLLNDGNTFVETFTQDINAGTSTYEQVLSVVLKKQTKAMAVSLALIVKARPVCVILDRMGNYKVMGISDGTVSTGSLESGGGKAEFNGINLTLTSIETEPAPYLDATATSAFELVIDATKETP